MKKSKNYSKEEWIELESMLSKPFVKKLKQTVDRGDLVNIYDVINTEMLYEELASLSPNSKGYKYIMESDSKVIYNAKPLTDVISDILFKVIHRFTGQENYRLLGHACKKQNFQIIKDIVNSKNRFISGQVLYKEGLLEDTPLHTLLKAGYRNNKAEIIKIATMFFEKGLRPLERNRENKTVINLVDFPDGHELYGLYDDEGYKYPYDTKEQKLRFLENRAVIRCYGERPLSDFDKIYKEIDADTFSDINIDFINNVYDNIKPMENASLHDIDKELLAEINGRITSYSGSISYGLWGHYDSGGSINTLPSQKSVIKLLDLGADLNSFHDGETIMVKFLKNVKPKLYAKKVEFLKELLERGGDPTIKSRITGKTPTDIVIEREISQQSKEDVEDKDNEVYKLMNKYANKEEQQQP
jgi:hypothetical protein